MIRQEIYIDSYEWHVSCYYAIDHYFINEIARKLIDVGCSGDTLDLAIKNMASKKLNNGLCYSNTTKGESVLVIALTSSPSQFLNSLAHEVHHLTEHVCHARGVDCQSEEAAYLCGDITQEIYPYVKSLLCEHCGIKYRNYGR